MLGLKARWNSWAHVMTIVPYNIDSNHRLGSRKNIHESITIPTGLLIQCYLKIFLGIKKKL